LAREKAAQRYLFKDVRPASKLIFTRLCFRRENDAPKTMGPSSEIVVVAVAMASVTSGDASRLTPETCGVGR